MPGQAKMTAACRDLKNTIRVARRAVVSVAGRTVMIGVVVMRVRELLEDMVHLMRCRIKQEKYKRRGPKSGPQASNRRPAAMNQMRHRETKWEDFIHPWRHVQAPVYAVKSASSAPSGFIRQCSWIGAGFLPRANRTSSTAIKSAAEVSTMVAAEEMSN